jgi:hypothetical protein
MPLWLWWTLGAVAALVAGLGVLFIGRKNAPKWITIPLVFGAAVLAGVGAFQGVLDLREPSFSGEVDCEAAEPLSSSELDAIKVLVL